MAVLHADDAGLFYEFLEGGNRKGEFVIFRIMINHNI